MGYCEPTDVYLWIPEGSVPTPRRLLSAVSAATDVMSLDGHGFAADAELLFRAEAGGSLPSPLVEGTAYYAAPLTDSTFSVAATAGGSVVNLTTAGSNVVVISEIPWARWIAIATDRIDGMLFGHRTPLDAPYPASVTYYAAGLVAEMALGFAGAQTASIIERLKVAHLEFERWRKGATIRGAVVPAAANKAIRGTVTASDPRGWAARGNGVLP